MFELMNSWNYHYDKWSAAIFTKANVIHFNFKGVWSLFKKAFNSIWLSILNAYNCSLKFYRHFSSYKRNIEVQILCKLVPFLFFFLLLHVLHITVKASFYWAFNISKFYMTLSKQFLVLALLIVISNNAFFSPATLM